MFSPTKPTSSLNFDILLFKISFPFHVTNPESGSTMLRMALIVVGFPAPFIPIRPIISPGSHEKETLSSLKSLYSCDIFLICNNLSIITYLLFKITFIVIVDSSVETTREIIKIVITKASVI